jgi:nitrite transporter NirC
MYGEVISALSEQAAAKMEHQHRSLPGHLVRSMAAGMYVGAAIVLIMTVGGLLSKDSPALVRILMGVCFGGALTMVIFAGSELFTGSNLVLTLGVLSRKVRLSDLAANWLWTWVGNLAGSVLLAYLVVKSGVLTADPVRAFILKVTETKMAIAADQLFIRAMLANWLVCLGVWMSVRIKSESAKILMVWWCMFTFITCGYEHSVANMTTLMLGYLLPHEASAAISMSGYWYNLMLATLGNIVGGAVFVGMLYWVGSAKGHAAVQPVQAAVAGELQLRAA